MNQGEPAELSSMNEDTPLRCLDAEPPKWSRHPSAIARQNHAQRSSSILRGPRRNSLAIFRNGAYLDSKLDRGGNLALAIAEFVDTELFDAKFERRSRET